MGFWSNLFGKKQRESQNLEATYGEQNNSYAMWGSYMVWTRDDGSQLKIMPMTVENGAQDCRYIFDKETGEQIPVARFRILKDNLQGKIESQDIWMEYSANYFQNPQYDGFSRYIVNETLSESNLANIENNQQGYAGGLMYGADGNTLETFVRSGCVETLRDEYEQAIINAQANNRTEQNIRNTQAVERSAGYDFSSYTTSENARRRILENDGYDR